MPEFENSDLLPEIIIDDSADGYVETDDEMEEEEEEPAEKSRPPASEIFHSQSQQEEPVLEVRMSDEELPEERQPEPAPQLSVQPIPKPKRQASAKQREHLARIRVKAAESRRQKTAQRQQQHRPATARSTPHPTFSEGDVDRLLDRYKERRRVKKAVKTKPDSSVLQQSPAQTINADLHTVAPVDDPWAECFL